jgi:cobalt-zinc-cadmium efflux system membrane fusion protein
MSEVPNDPMHPSEAQESISRRALPADRQWRIAGVGAVVVVFIIALVWLGGRLLGQRERPPAAAAPPGTFRATAQQLKTFTIAPVAVHEFVSEELTEGKIAVNADRATPVYSPFSGRVIRVIAGLGDRVKEGAPLATLEAAEFVQGQSDLRSAASQLRIARISEARKHALYDAKGGSLQDWQQAQADLTAAETALDSVRNRLRILGKSEDEIAALEAAKSTNPVAALNAPISGVVVDRQLGPGQYLQAGSGTPVFTIADPASVWLLANVREADAGEIRLGQAVEVHVLAYPQRAFKARITHISAVVDPVTHRLSVRAEIDNRDGALKPEMFANFRILTSDSVSAPAVPESAVVYEGEMAHVWVFSGTDLLSFRAIRPGRTNDGVVEVLDGLKPGERIVIKGGLFIDQMASPAAS